MQIDLATYHPLDLSFFLSLCALSCREEGFALLLENEGEYRERERERERVREGERERGRHVELTLHTTCTKGCFPLQEPTGGSRAAATFVPVPTAETAPVGPISGPFLAEK